MANVGTVQSVTGVVKAIAEDGTERILSVGDSVAENEKIITGDGVIVIAFTDGTVLDLGSNSSIVLNDDVLNQAGEQTAQSRADAEDEVAALQQALADPNFDPTANLPATAAGTAAGGTGNNGHSIVSVDYLNPDAPVESGHDTVGINQEFLQPDEELPPVIDNPPEADDVLTAANRGDELPEGLQSALLELGLGGSSGGGLPEVLNVGSLSGSRGSTWTLDGSNMVDDTRAKLENDANFGAGGIIPSDIQISDISEPLTLELLNNFDVFFIGYYPEGTLTEAELQALSDWAEAGGTLIITADSGSYDQVASYFGYPTASGAVDPMTVTSEGETNPIFDGPFGEVESFLMWGTQGYFTNTDGATILAVDDNGLPVVLETSFGDGNLILLADVDILSDNGLTDGENVDLGASNDVLFGNLFAYAAELAGDGSSASDTEAPVPTSNELINGLGGIAGFGENTFGANDDGSIEVDVTSVFGAGGLDFFGTTYTSIFINNNGNITFGSALGTFTPFALTGDTGIPIIAPYFADVETTGGPIPVYDESGNSTGSNLVYWDLDEVNGVITITWDDVGYFADATDLSNAFQLIIYDNGDGNFSFEFRYEDINWTTGDASGGTDGLGGSVATAGWSAGDGENFFALPQSGEQD
ncbi:hypothetical protein A9Q85_06395, partial [Cycloclasticus sp. 44_32_T64]